MPQTSLKDVLLGINEILARQGLLQGNWCCPTVKCCRGQAEEIERVYRMYPNFHDDKFVERFLAEYKVQLV